MKKGPTISNTPMICASEFAEREVKFAPLKLDEVGTDGFFEGYASLFNTVDMARDQVMPGAFKRSLQARPPMSVRLLYQHDPAEPIGIWEALIEDRKGLYVKGRLLRDIARARDVHLLMKRGALYGLSIGFRTRRARRQPGTNIRQLYEVDLYEISIVTFPMHPGARVAAVKAAPAANGLPTVREFERWLMRDAGFTRRQAQMAISKGFKALSKGLKGPHAIGHNERVARDLRTLTRKLQPTRGSYE